MQNDFRKFVTDRPKFELLQIVMDWSIFEDVGAIGECLLRQLAREWCNLKLCGNFNVTVMKDIAFEAFRELYRLSLQK